MKYFPNGYPECYPLYLYFFESEEYPNHYVILSDIERTRNNWYERLTRQGAYSYELYSEEEIARGAADYYPKIKIKKPVKIKTDQKDYFTSRFFKYLKQVQGMEHIDNGENFPNPWGWYKFKGALELEKWLTDFAEFENKGHEKLIKAESEGKQISMF